ncbi:hypothetical protein BJV82DRAFT_666158 [Fennellomyces sp. T-0311]|nr:hypothetical protein BJV82DRAFT_666158 [Fennellomyces sp. T-0311]
MPTHYVLFLILRAITILVVLRKLLPNLYSTAPFIIATASTISLDAIATFRGYSQNIAFDKEHPFDYANSLAIDFQMLALLQSTLLWTVIATSLLTKEGMPWIKAHFVYFNPTLIGIIISAIGAYSLPSTINYSSMESFQQCAMLVYTALVIYALIHWRNEQLPSSLLAYGYVTLLQPLRSSTTCVTILLSHLGHAQEPYELMTRKTLPVLSFMLYFFDIQTPLILLLLTLRSGPHWATRQLQTNDVEKAGLDPTIAKE